MVWNVFLSSTVKDLAKLRQAVQDALHQRVGAACFLSEEDWPGSYDDTVALCQGRVQEANGFLLLLGYWYGWVPEGSPHSITQLEFELAMSRWGDLPFPPLAVFLPEVPSPLEKQLRQAALALLEEAGWDAADHQKRLGDFHDRVAGPRARRVVNRFRDRQELRELAIVICKDWQGKTPLAAVRGAAPEVPPAAVSQVTDPQLGRLGRKAQHDAVEAALAAVADHADVPALALVVHGDEDAGQRPFLLRLVQTALRDQHPGRVARLPLGHHDLPELVSWVAQALRLAGGGATTPEQLAEQVAAELKAQPLCFVLDRIAYLEGGATAFREAFWLPFYTKLCELRAAQAFSHRLVAVVADYSDDAAAWLPSACAPDDAPDYTRLLLVPRLGPIKRAQFLQWLNDLKVPDQPAGRRAELADRVLRNEKGQDDPVAMRVFERLRGETLWPEGEQE